MLGLMQDQPLLISNLIEFADKLTAKIPKLSVNFPIFEGLKIPQISKFLLFE